MADLLLRNENYKTPRMKRKAVKIKSVENCISNTEQFTVKPT